MSSLVKKRKSTGAKSTVNSTMSALLKAKYDAGKALDAAYEALSIHRLYHRSRVGYDATSYGDRDRGMMADIKRLESIHAAAILAVRCERNRRKFSPR